MIEIIDLFNYVILIRYNMAPYLAKVNPVRNINQTDIIYLYIDIIYQDEPATTRLYHRY